MMRFLLFILCCTFLDLSFVNVTVAAEISKDDEPSSILFSNHPGHKISTTKLEEDFISLEVNSVLRSGRPYVRQVVEGLSGNGTVVVDIEAPVETVWKMLRNLDDYPSRIHKLTRSKPSSVTEISTDKVTNVFAQKFTMSFGFFRKLTFTLKLQEEIPGKLLVWTLESSTALKSLLGFWYLEAHSTRENCTRAIFHGQLTAHETIPEYFRYYLMEHALQDATDWLKAASEFETRNAEQSFEATSCKADEEDSSRSASWNVARSQQPQPIGVSRYLLVSSVCGLLGLNIYLYFSHYRK